MHKAAMELAVDIYGPEAMLRTTGPESWPATTRTPSSPVGYTMTPMLSAFFFSRSETIWGGASQIQRNIVGEGVLGLPKEARKSVGEGKSVSVRVDAGGGG